MANGRISRVDGPFNSYANTTVVYLDEVDAGTGVANYVRLGLTVGERNQWAALKNTWNAAYALWGNVATRTKPVTANKNNAKQAFIDVVQPLVNFIAGRLDLLEEDFAAFNIKKRDTEPTARPAITTTPFPMLSPIGGGKVRVTVRRDEDEDRASMQPDADSILMRDTIGTTPPASEEEAELQMSYKRAIRIFALGQANAGLRMYAFFRWQNETDETKSGPWSTVVQTVIA